LSGIAGIIQFNGQPVAPFDMERMANRMRHRGPDGINSISSGMVGLSHANLALHQREIKQEQPLWLPDRSCAIVADARIYNREAILQRLDNTSWLSDETLDAAIILAAYERWQIECLDYLDGDFAFAIWDHRQKRLFAARDPFGTKPFFFYSDNHSFIFASEPKQILALPRVSIELDDLIIGEYLFASFRERERTFFCGVSRLQPGHLLLAVEVGVEQRRWWQPQPERQIHYVDERQYFDHFRELLKASIKRRLQTDSAIGVHLSGGRDSSSIVVLAADLQRQKSADFPAIQTISALYGDLSCDESPYIRTVTETVPFRNRTFSPPDIPFVPESTEDLWRVDAPIGSVQRGFTVGGAQLMQGIGARVLLDGVGGDEITHEVYYLRDIALRKQYLSLLRESWLASKTTRASFSSLMLDAVAAAAPTGLKRIYHQLNQPLVWQPPTWANQDLAAFFMERSEPAAFDWSRYNSLTQGLIFRQFFDPYFSWAQEVAEAKASYSGYELRHPYCDRSLVEFVMAMPFEHRISGGQWRYLQLRALKGYLPDAIIKRPDQTTFEEYVVQILATAVPRWQKTLFGTDRWESARYVNRRDASQLFESYRPSEYVLGDAIHLWRIAFVELWLRQLTRYEMVPATSGHYRINTAQMAACFRENS
jgi:asparagine synthase (glutamine-hydrolysing)